VPNLDVLVLDSFVDMERLNQVRQYLMNRINHSKYEFTIFRDPVKGCFAERYVTTSPLHLKLLETIRNMAENERNAKEEELLQLSETYQNLIGETAGMDCATMPDDFRPWIPVHNPNCKKCRLRGRARRMKITIFEWPLPSDEIFAKAAVFELNLPKTFALYRDVTWNILGLLAHTNHPPQSAAYDTIHKYSGLLVFNKTGNSPIITLGSTTKSFRQSHYESVRLPTHISAVCHPNGLKLRYYDTSNELWVSNTVKSPSFAHHCEMIVPIESPFSSLCTSSSAFAAGGIGLSSYDILAEQTRCPDGVSVNEFMAFQNLFGGTSRRWPSLLIELGANNLNFSSEAPCLLASRVARQVGPPTADDSLGKVHSILREGYFCQRLLEQLTVRLDNISQNWRETTALSMILNLCLKVHSVSVGIESKAITSITRHLIERIRLICVQWIKALRSELNISDIQSSKRASRYCLQAALIGRRTLLVFERQDIIPARPLKEFIQCSIALQENLTEDPETLPVLLRNAIVCDTRMVYRYRHKLSLSVKNFSDSIIEAIDDLLPPANSAPARRISSLVLLQPPNQWWIQAIVSETIYTREQKIHYNLLQGHLLIDGINRGKLPAEHRTSDCLVELFSDQILLTYSSSLPGMKYLLHVRPNGYQIHVGFRDKSTVVRAFGYDRVLEYVPRDIFRSMADSDLPLQLVNDCVHWLDIKTSELFIRRKPHIFKRKRNEWCLDLRTRRCVRGDKELVDPRSGTFHNVAKCFSNFEDAAQLIVFKPANRSLSVELPRLELLFEVNHNGLLRSRRLHADVDLVQDSGAFYGLASQLIVRDIINPRMRSILVPMGKLHWDRSGIHVRVTVREKIGIYCRYTINETLGRLDCPAEPLLLYLKAYLHAVTSFVIPDPLTGRTGIEEAIGLLQKGICQPWQPLGQNAITTLNEILALPPKREYYPRDLKCMQQVVWNENLTIATQHEDLCLAIEGILRANDRLSRFNEPQLNPVATPIIGNVDLMERARRRRKIYERTSGVSYPSTAAQPYRNARGPLHHRSLNVLDTVVYLNQWSNNLPEIANVHAIAQSFPIIGGFDRVFVPRSLSDTLDSDLGPEFGGLINFCRVTTFEDRFRLIFLLGLVAYRKNTSMDFVRLLIAYSVLPQLKSGLEPPSHSIYNDLKYTQVPTVELITDILKPFGKNFESATGIRMDSWACHKRVKKDGKTLAKFLVAQWPCEIPTFDGIEKSLFLRLDEAYEVILSTWSHLRQNEELSTYLKEVQIIVTRHCSRKQASHSSVICHKCLSFLPLPQSAFERAPTLSHLMHISVPQKLNSLSTFDLSSMHQTTRSEQIKMELPSSEVHDFPDVPNELKELQSITQKMSSSGSQIRTTYKTHLQNSIRSLRSLSRNNPIYHIATRYEIQAAISQNKVIIRNFMTKIESALEAGENIAPWLKLAGSWPAITLMSILEQLRTPYESKPQFNSLMKKSFVELGLTITHLQRLIRMEAAHLKRSPDIQRLKEEIENTGHTNWNPMDIPEWLLLEIDANMMIRPGQVDVARATILPPHGLNSLLQMNMGQGKTSVVIPMVALCLANKKNLLRLIVPKALLLQTAQLLHRLLGNLLDRNIKHIPFSRRTSTSQSVTRLYRELHEESLQNGGIMLCLAEHLLSFQLSGLQRLSDGLLIEAKPMIQAQKWLRMVARDVLDESDHTLDVRTQLIYPSGSLITVHGHPHRWEAIEDILNLIWGHLNTVSRTQRNSIEVVDRDNGGFPFFYLLRKDAEDALLQVLVNDIVYGRTSVLSNFADIKCSQSDRKALKEFISEATVLRSTTEKVRNILSGKPIMEQVVCLFRGLIAHRILIPSLKKRWNVQYGLDPRRDPIAVPYQAKGVPSDQAEFGHPDVAIILTVLAFYYEGLSALQIKQSLAHLLKSDDPAAVYDRWIIGIGDLPHYLRDWNSINVDDVGQLEEWVYKCTKSQHEADSLYSLRRSLRYNTQVIKYYLNTLVFPRHAKQFEVKLSTSAWDIPLYNPADDVGVVSSSPPLTTGFSGTNDTRDMLPLNITQQDLPQLTYTNAEVLTYLLQPRNRGYYKCVDDMGRRLSELDLLDRLTYEGIRVLIDAGAMILEMDNHTLVKEWLKYDTFAEAAVFFDEQNRPMVAYRNSSRTVPLSVSAFVENLRKVLVYIDESHTRGTDLKLPADACGALTLGVGQTKDHTVQAAMRLRNLSTTQSVKFFAPPEVHHNILQITRKTEFDRIDSSDVISWLLEQTVSGMETLQPLYYAQGMEYCRRMQASFKYSKFLNDTNHCLHYIQALRQKESQTLQELYWPKSSKYKRTIANEKMATEKLNEFSVRLNDVKNLFFDNGSAASALSHHEVEQEREIQQEVEAVREVQRPVRYKAHKFPGLHEDIIEFATKKVIKSNPTGLKPMFEGLRMTGIGRKHCIQPDSNVVSGKLFVSTEFFRIVDTVKGQKTDHIQVGLQRGLKKKPD
jgi:hypothetical protein